ncbi:lipoprotein-releasing ABC transporter permease subunit [Alteromonas flava]|uniref:lipoprotein-releasing ABC transporter permease subunit n=1 Tax=Alteromonas flava TaxID=2048003 RepID=UPI000C28A054|nr:lipoprotein-releasing ABC transporter permease subunit [Alteromonas flava]
MFHPVFAFIGLRYSKAKQSSSFVAFINFFSVAGITLGIMALIVVLSVMNGFEGQLKQRILGVMPHVVAQAPATQITQLALPEVTGAMPYTEAEGVLQTPNALRGVMIQGVDPVKMAQYSIIDDNLLVGQLSDLTPGSYHIIIGRALASQLGIRPGEPLRLLLAGASVYTPFGRVPSQRLVEVVGVFDMGSELDDKTLYMHVNDLQRLKRETGPVATSRLFLHDAFAYQATADVLARESIGYDTWRARQGPLFDAVKMEKNMMFLLLLLVIAVAAFNIISALVMVVNEKQGDIAILMTLGMRRTSVMTIFLFNGMLNGLKGAALGTLLGVLLVLGLNPMFAALGVSTGYSLSGGLPIDLRFEQVIGVAAFALLLCVLSTLYPAFKALSVEPARALQYE